MPPPARPQTHPNPVLGGFHPDPSVCRVDTDYYLVTSSFEYFPGVPVFHSPDLVHWRQIGNVLDRPEQLRLPPELTASGGIYAPTIRHHDGRFFMITTNVGDRGNFIVHSRRPDGPWSDPAWLDLPGWDPDLAWDEDGTCWCALATGPGALHVAQIDPVAAKVLAGPWPIWSGTGLQYPEAPHLYRIGSWWYLLIAEGGTDRGHSVSIARGPSPRGPFESAPGNPMLTHRSTNRTVQSTGHSDLVQAPDGSWSLVLLGTRPHGRLPGFHVLGRETFLTPVDWVDGWPAVGPVEERPEAQPPAVRDDFDDPRLAPEWISLRSRPDTAWSLSDRPGWLTLHAAGDSLDRPGHTFVGRRVQHTDCRVRVLLDAGPAARAGITVRIDEAHHYDVEVAAGQARAIARIGPLRQCVGEQPVPDGPVVLGIDIRTHDLLPPHVTSAAQVDGPLGVPAGGPDTVALSVDAGSGPVVLAELDGRYVSTEVATGFTGRVAGMYVTEGTAVFDWYEYVPDPPSHDHGEPVSP